MKNMSRRLNNKRINTSKRKRIEGLESKNRPRLIEKRQYSLQKSSKLFNALSILRDMFRRKSQVQIISFSKSQGKLCQKSHNGLIVSKNWFKRKGKRRIICLTLQMDWILIIISRTLR